MLENAIRIAVDSIFLPPDPLFSKRKQYICDNAFSQNQFELIFDELTVKNDLDRIFMTIGKEGIYKE